MFHIKQKKKKRNYIDKNSQKSMGNASAKPARTAPARYVAKQLPRAPQDIEAEFAKAKHTIQGINKMKEKVSTTPQPHVEQRFKKEATQETDNTPPRWYMNTWMEMMDNVRTDRAVVSGALPNAWSRDHHEPYALVRNRIDDEDLDWLLNEGKKMPIQELLQHTKLEREALEDILATVEAPRRQYRNYQGKLHKAVEETNTFIADRAKRMEENRNEELLRQIGFTDEELEDEKQYLTNRSRGVKTLDDLGASIRRKKRTERFAVHTDMEILLEERKAEQIEAGTYEPTEKELERPEHAGVPKGQYYKSRFNAHKKTFRLDMSNDERDEKHRNKIVDWLEDRKKVEYGVDKYPDDLPKYHEGVSQSEESLKEELDRNSSRNMMLAKATGAKKWADPRQQYDTMLGIMRNTDQSRDGTVKDPKIVTWEEQEAARAASKEGQAEAAAKAVQEGANSRMGYTPRAERAGGAPPAGAGAADADAARQPPPTDGGQPKK